MTGPTIALRISGMTCSNCVRHVAEALRSVPGVLDARVDLEAGRAEVTFTGAASPAALVAVVADAGYEAEED